METPHHTDGTGIVTNELHGYACNRFEISDSEKCNLVLSLKKTGHYQFRKKDRSSRNELIKNYSALFDPVVKLERLIPVSANGNLNVSRPCGKQTLGDKYQPSESICNCPQGCAKESKLDAHGKTLTSTPSEITTMNDTNLANLPCTGLNGTDIIDHADTSNTVSSTSIYIIPDGEMTDPLKNTRKPSAHTNDHEFPCFMELVSRCTLQPVDANTKTDKSPVDHNADSKHATATSIIQQQSNSLTNEDTTVKTASTDFQRKLTAFRNRMKNLNLRYRQDNLKTTSGDDSSLKHDVKLLVEDDVNNLDIVTNVESKQDIIKGVVHNDPDTRDATGNTEVAQLIVNDNAAVHGYIRDNSTENSVSNEGDVKISHSENKDVKVKNDIKKGYDEVYSNGITEQNDNEDKDDFKDKHDIKMEDATDNHNETKQNENVCGFAKVDVDAKHDRDEDYTKKLDDIDNHNNNEDNKSAYSNHVVKDDAIGSLDHKKECVQNNHHIKKDIETNKRFSGCRESNKSKADTQNEILSDVSSKSTVSCHDTVKTVEDITIRCDVLDLNEMNEANKPTNLTDHDDQAMIYIENTETGSIELLTKEANINKHGQRMHHEDKENHNQSDTCSMEKISTLEAPRSKKRNGEITSGNEKCDIFMTGKCKNACENNKHPASNEIKIEDDVRLLLCEILEKIDSQCGKEDIQHLNTSAKKVISDSGNNNSLHDKHIQISVAEVDAESNQVISNHEDCDQFPALHIVMDDELPRADDGDEGDVPSLGQIGNKSDQIPANTNKEDNKHLVSKDVIEDYGSTTEEDDTYIPPKKRVRKTPKRHPVHKQKTEQNKRNISETKAKRSRKERHRQNVIKIFNTRSRSRSCQSEPIEKMSADGEYESDKNKLQFRHVDSTDTTPGKKLLQSSHEKCENTDELMPTSNSFPELTSLNMSDHEVGPDNLEKSSKREVEFVEGIDCQKQGQQKQPSSFSSTNKSQMETSIETEARLSQEFQSHNWLEKKIVNNGFQVPDLSQKSNDEQSVNKDSEKNASRSPQMEKHEPVSGENIEEDAQHCKTPQGHNDTTLPKESLIDKYSPIPCKLGHIEQLPPKELSAQHVGPLRKASKAMGHVGQSPLDTPSVNKQIIVTNKQHFEEQPTHCGEPSSTINTSEGHWTEAQSNHVHVPTMVTKKGGDGLNVSSRPVVELQPDPKPDLPLNKNTTPTIMIDDSQESPVADNSLDSDLVVLGQSTIRNQVMPDVISDHLRQSRQSLEIQHDDIYQNRQSLEIEYNKLKIKLAQIELRRKKIQKEKICLRQEKIRLLSAIDKVRTEYKRLVGKTKDTSESRAHLHRNVRLTTTSKQHDNQRQDILDLTKDDDESVVSVDSEQESVIPVRSLSSADTSAVGALPTDSAQHAGNGTPQTGTGQPAVNGPHNTGSLPPEANGHHEANVQPVANGLCQADSLQLEAHRQHQASKQRQEANGQHQVSHVQLEANGPQNAGRFQPAANGPHHHGRIEPFHPESLQVESPSNDIEIIALHKRPDTSHQYKKRKKQLPSYNRTAHVEGLHHAHHRTPPPAHQNKSSNCYRPWLDDNPFRSPASNMGQASVTASYVQRAQIEITTEHTTGDLINKGFSSSNATVHGDISSSLNVNTHGQHQRRHSSTAENIVNALTSTPSPRQASTAVSGVPTLTSQKRYNSHGYTDRTAHIRQKDDGAVDLIRRDGHKEKDTRTLTSTSQSEPVSNVIDLARSSQRQWSSDQNGQMRTSKPPPPPVSSSHVQYMGMPAGNLPVSVSHLPPPVVLKQGSDVMPPLVSHPFTSLGQLNNKNQYPVPLPLSAAAFPLSNYPASLMTTTHHSPSVSRPEVQLLSRQHKDNYQPHGEALPGGRLPSFPTETDNVFGPQENVSDTYSHGLTSCGQQQRHLVATSHSAHVVPRSPPSDSSQGMSVTNAPLPQKPSYNIADTSPLSARTCGNCKEPKATYLCSGCKKVWYCSPKCQMDAWNHHSQDCS